MQIEGTTPLWVAARNLLRKRGDDFFLQTDKVLETFAPENIHDLRVASRRLREGLTLFSPCYPAKKISFLAKKVKRVTRLLGATRNTDEALLFFAALTEELGDVCRDYLENLVATLRKRRRKSMKKLQAGLRKATPKSLRNLYQRTIDNPSLFSPQTEGFDVFLPLSTFTDSAIADRLVAVLQLVPAARETTDVDAQHQLRIAIKHFRYRLEILSFLISKNYEELHGIVKSYQEVLGKMHDLDVFAEIVRGTTIPSPVDKLILECIALKRAHLFADFSSMLENTPLASVETRVTNVREK